VSLLDNNDKLHKFLEKSLETLSKSADQHISESIQEKTFVHFTEEDLKKLTKRRKPINKFTIRDMTGEEHTFECDLIDEQDGILSVVLNHQTIAMFTQWMWFKQEHLSEVEPNIEEKL
jgi:hypothetical protein